MSSQSFRNFQKEPKNKKRCHVAKKEGREGKVLKVFLLIQHIVLNIFSVLI
ncbi:Protein CBG25250 [Caenorhabditis briggsae]|uniref:Protein CBG25250 n=1 Tax=Caenorhabditis briggsae TaxID=6238 RepID=B6IFM0_CAEBR|nr:Protein CBG25250 [Caenorhabditis briggsae]CAR98700.1 Protein CBG25250 [Caenorhabditis briggsae]